MLISAMTTTAAVRVRWALGYPVAAMGILLLLASSCAGAGGLAPPPADSTPVQTPSLTSQRTLKGVVSPASAAPAVVPTHSPGSSPSPTLPALSSGLPGTGIEGLIVIGPSCAAVSQAHPCPDVPFAATVSVRDGAGKEEAKFTTGGDGRFRVELPPGTYTLVPINPNPIPSIPPRGQEQTVTVIDGKLTPVLVQYDSGIR